MPASKPHTPRRERMNTWHRRGCARMRHRCNGERPGHVHCRSTRRGRCGRGRRPQTRTRPGAGPPAWDHVHSWKGRAGSIGGCTGPVMMTVSCCRCPNHLWSVMSMPGSRLCLQDRVEIRSVLRRSCLTRRLAWSCRRLGRRCCERSVRVAAATGTALKQPNVGLASRRCARRCGDSLLIGSCSATLRKDSRSGGRRRRSRWQAAVGSARRRSTRPCTPGLVARSVPKHAGDSSRNAANAALDDRRKPRNATSSARDPPNRDQTSCRRPASGGPLGR